MIIQIDIDGTLDQAPAFFRWMTKALRNDRQTILIVSSRTTSTENLKLSADELKGWGITYDKLILSPNLNDLDARQFPKDLHPGHKLYVYKLIVARDFGTEVLFDDCGITAELFRKHLPQVKVFKPIR